MDFDDDDPLDDLLRDGASSSNNWKTQNANPTLVHNDPPPATAVNSKKEKKSALLAELFGPPTSDLLDFPPPITSGSSEELPNVKFDLKTETPTAENVCAAADFSLGSYVPSLGSKLASAPVKSVFPSDIFTSRNDSLPNVSKKEEPILNILEQNTVRATSDNSSSQKEMASDPVLKSNQLLHHMFSQPVESLPTIQVSKPLETMKIEQTLDRFAERLCEELRRLAEREDCLKSISTGLNNLAQIQSQPQKMGTDLEQRLVKLETAVDLLNSHVQKLDGRVTSQQQDVSLMKLDLENRLGKQLELMQGMVDRLETSLTSNWDKQRNEMESKHQEWERMTQQYQGLTKDPISSEMAQILKAELKWLERQKNKLHQQRENNEKLNSVIEERFRQLTHLSEVIKNLMCIE